MAEGLGFRDSGTLVSGSGFQGSGEFPQASSRTAPGSRAGGLRQEGASFVSWPGERHAAASRLRVLGLWFLQIRV